LISKFDFTLIMEKPKLELDSHTLLGFMKALTFV